MPIPSSGALSLNDIQTEFGGSPPISISEYYAGAGLVPSGTTGTNGAIPTSGQISISQFYGTSAGGPYYFAASFRYIWRMALEDPATNNVFLSTYSTQQIQPIGVGGGTVVISNSSLAVGTLATWPGNPTPAGPGNLFMGRGGYQQQAFYYDPNSSSFYTLDQGVRWAFNTSGVWTSRRQTPGLGALSWVPWDNDVIVDSSSTSQYRVGFLYKGNNPYNGQPEGTAFIHKTGAATTWSHVYGFIRESIPVPVPPFVDPCYGQEYPQCPNPGPPLNASNSNLAGILDSTRTNLYVLNNLCNDGVGLLKVTASSFSISFSKRYTPLDTASSGAGLTGDSSGIYLSGSNNAPAAGELYVVKVNTTGAITWQRKLTLTSPWKATPLSLKVDSSGSVYAHFFMTNNAPATPVTTMFIVKYNSSGTIQWQRSIVSASQNMFWRNAQTNVTNKTLQVTTKGDLLISGHAFNYGGSGNFGPSYVARLPSNGSKTGTYTAGTPCSNQGSFTYAASSLTDSAGSLSVSDYSVRYVSYNTTGPWTCLGIPPAGFGPPNGPLPFFGGNTDIMTTGSI